VTGIVFAPLAGLTAFDELRGRKPTGNNISTSLDPVAQQTAFDLLAGWATVTTSAAGVYGFSRATSENLMQGK
jgi:hypothetical protein